VSHRQAALIALVLLALFIVPVAARQKFSSRTLGVRVDVLVTDGRNPVAGLTDRDFELRDNGVVQRVEVIDAANVPINAVLALDTSASITGRRRADLVSAGDALIDGLQRADRAGLTTFSHAVSPTIPLTSDLIAVRSALRSIEPFGQTSVMDGVYVALTSTLDQSGRFLIVVCTDGSDTTSWLQPSEVLDAAKRANGVVYAVTAGDAKGSSALRELADATGGQVLQVKSSADLRAAFQRILTEFRSRYVLAYSPDGVAAGGFHRLEISVPGRRATVKARAGYIGVEPRKQP
jgi:VWFA-related protein